MIDKNHPLSELLNELDAISNLSEPSRMGSIRNCRQFAMRFDLMFIYDPSIRWAVFKDGGNGVVLVMHSRESKRQVTFEFVSNELLVDVIKIDERMDRFTYTYRTDQMAQLRAAIMWVKY